MTFDQFYRSSGQYKYFGSHEWLTKGSAHSNRSSAGFGLNTDPPFELWANAIPLFRAVDDLRGLAGSRIALVSVYRSPAYNRAIGGASQSYHMKFMAADLVPLDITPRQLWVCAQANRQSLGIGGIGRYRTFVHVDVRDGIADWTG